MRADPTERYQHSIDDTARLLAIARDIELDADERTAGAWALIGNYRPLILKTVVSVVRSFGQTPTEQAVELLHNEAALKLVGALHRFHGEPEQFGAWTRVVVRHLSISALGAEARQRQALADDAPLARVPAPDPRPDEHVLAAEEAQTRADRLAVLDDALERLRSGLSDPKDGERYQAFYLKEQEGMTFADVAAHLHISESSARNRHREARQRLRRFIDEARGVA
ncbi:MAG: sigma-70 family RNA polymerase sigma factor [Actinomycetota bacterium]